MVIINNLDELGGYKQTIIKSLLENQDIIDLVLPNPSEDYDIDVQLLGSDTIRDKDGNLMFEGQIFPYYYTDGTEEDAKTFILVDDNVPRVRTNDLLKNVNILIYIFSHKSLVRLSTEEKNKFIIQKGYKGTCRTDILATIVDNILNKSTVFGIKKLKLESVDIYKPNNNFYGRVLIYSAICENIGGDYCGN